MDHIDDDDIEWTDDLYSLVWNDWGYIRSGVSREDRIRLVETGFRIVDSYDWTIGQDRRYAKSINKIIAKID